MYRQYSIVNSQGDSQVSDFYFYLFYTLLIFEETHIEFNKTIVLVLVHFFEEKELVFLIHGNKK